MAKNIAVIGLGQIGRRHMEALAKCDFKARLFLIDPDNESLDATKQFLKEIPKNSLITKIFLGNHVDLLPKRIDFSVISTNSNVRLKVLEELLSKVKITSLLLEKVLFQNSTEVLKAKGLLKKNNVSTWVNCPRRMWPIYKDLRPLLKDKKRVSYILEGGKWGMGCNAIHLIDIFEWLTNSKIMSINTEELDPVIHESKRNGFIEFSGSLKASFAENNEMLMKSDFHREDSSFKITIKGEDFSLFINEGTQKIKIDSSKKEFKEIINKINFKIPYQSQLTHKVAKKAIFSNKSELTTYDDSAYQHKMLLDSLKKHLEKISKKQIENCPIT